MERDFIYNPIKTEPTENSNDQEDNLIPKLEFIPKLEDQESLLVKNWTSVGWDCYYCNHSFFELKAFQEHLKLEHLIGNTQESNYKCSACCEPFFSYAVFLNHIRSIHYDILKLCCDICNQVLPDYEELSVHRDRHIAESCDEYPIVYHCTLCEIVQPTENELRSHIYRLHALGNLDKVNQCFQTNTECRNDRNDIKINNNETEQTNAMRYECDFCEETFINKASKRVHLRIHEDPNECDLCKKCFTTRGSLKRHWRNCKRNQRIDNAETLGCPVSSNTTNEHSPIDCKETGTKGNSLKSDSECLDPLSELYRCKEEGPKDFPSSSNSDKLQSLRWSKLTQKTRKAPLDEVRKYLYKDNPKKHIKKKRTQLFGDLSSIRH